MAKMKNPDKLGGSLDGPSPKTPAPKAPVKAKQAERKNPDKLGGSLDGPSPKTPAPKAPVKAKQAERKDPVSKVIQDITNRYRVTAREARDIVTAVGTVANLATNKDAASNKNVGVSRTTEVKKAISGVKKQVSETVRAAKTGKSGTTAAEVSTRRGEKPLVYGDTKKRR